MSAIDEWKLVRDGCKCFVLPWQRLIKFPEIGSYLFLPSAVSAVKL